MSADLGLRPVTGRLAILLAVGVLVFVHAVDGVRLSSLSGMANRRSLSSDGKPASGQGGHRHSILQVIHNKNSQLLDPSEFLNRDDARVQWLHSKMIPTTKDTTAGSDVSIPATYGINIGTANFLVTVGLGTPMKQLQLVIETGSPLTWTQCQPCLKSCYSQIDPIFDPSSSSTYSEIPCSSSTCNYLYQGNPQYCYTDNSCGYSITYGDGSNATGPLAMDTLTLTSSVNLPSYIFLCGQDNEGFVGSDGLLGLSNDGIFSMVRQGASLFGEFFSYCLPSSTESTGFLVLGNKDTNASTDFLFTPIITLPENPEFYGIGITGISVGGVTLSMSSKILLNSTSIIDSGTVITRLPLPVYAELRSAFRKQMTQYTMAPPYSLFDTCYDFSSFSEITYPSIVINFRGGLSVETGFYGTFFVDTPSQVCLAFATPPPGIDIVIYGNVQQTSMEIAYDVTNKQLGFRANGCA